MHRCMLALPMRSAPHFTANNNTLFVGPASGNTGYQSDWLQEIFEGGVLESFDLVTIHPYRSDSPEMAYKDLLQVQDLIAEYAPFETTNKPMLNGEWGYGATTVGGLLKQAELFLRVILITTSTTHQPSIWYQACDPDGNEGEMGIVNCTGPMGNRTFTPLPAFVAAQTMIKAFRNDGKALDQDLDEDLGMRFVRRIPVFQNGVDTDDDWVLLYRANSDDRMLLLVAWTSSDIGHVVRLPAVFQQGECWSPSSSSSSWLTGFKKIQRKIKTKISRFTFMDEWNYTYKHTTTRCMCTIKKIGIVTKSFV